jgi:hypothetical protein
MGTAVCALIGVYAAIVIASVYAFHRLNWAHKVRMEWIDRYYDAARWLLTNDFDAYLSSPFHTHRKTCPFATDVLASFERMIFSMSYDITKFVVDRPMYDKVLSIEADMKKTA